MIAIQWKLLFTFIYYKKFYIENSIHHLLIIFTKKKFIKFTRMPNFKLRVEIEIESITNL